MKLNTKATIASMLAYGGIGVGVAGWLIADELPAKLAFAGAGVAMEACAAKLTYDIGKEILNVESFFNTENEDEDDDIVDVDYVVVESA